MAVCELCGEPAPAFELVIELGSADPIAFASPLRVCALCNHLLASGQHGRLAQRLSDEYDDFDSLSRATVAQLLQSRVRSASPIQAEPRPLTDLRRAGFEPLEEHTGLIEELAAQWPAEHRTALPDPRPEPLTDDGMMWLVRSPWPQLSVGDVLSILWPWVEREPYSHSDSVPRIAEVFGWTESVALARLAALPPA